MLVTRICDRDYYPWQPSKYNSTSESSRMSDRYDLPIPVQPDWQANYPCPPQHGNDNRFPRPLLDEFPRPLSTGNEAQRRDPNYRDGLRCSTDSVGPGIMKRTSPEEDNKTGASETCPVSDCSSRSSGPNNSRLVPSAETEGSLDQRRVRFDEDKDPAMGDEGDMEGDDDDMGEGDSASRPQTVEERLAARRKMKRFRHAS
ncbi:hypothetical protein L249_6266 [Ophiocordyceps polyrhachis-furcata BCC 54312]|uniref:Uncharacterized protein n=1 Tax=Ophiocordyceps polyrhachis-furcata BCC 54312 TaxID=1330021 RepID=A0A367L170_9HYPO|nr:hypothetical protein L249_6266 [Ophiocordyceps polyrhachis-furcata BCC 54312]